MSDERQPPPLAPDDAAREALLRLLRRLAGWALGDPDRPARDPEAGREPPAD